MSVSESSKYERRPAYHVQVSQTRYTLLARLLLLGALLLLLRSINLAFTETRQAADELAIAYKAKREAAATLESIKTQEQETKGLLENAREDRVQAEREKRKVEAEAVQQERQCRSETKQAEDRRQKKLDDAKWSVRTASFRDLNDFVRATESRAADVLAGAKENLTSYASLIAERDKLVATAVGSEKARVYQRVLGSPDEKIVHAFFERLQPGNYRDGLALSREALSKSQALSHTRSGFSAVGSDGQRVSLTETIPAGLFEVLPRDDALGDRFPRGGRWRTCALVGTSASLLRYKFGEAINAHDAIFRVGLAPTNGYEEHVGRRTTVRVVLDEHFSDEAMNRPSKETVAVRADSLDTLLKYIKAKEDRGREAFNVHLLSPEFAIFISRYMLRDPPAMFYSLAIALQKCRNITVYGLPTSDRSASHMLHLGVNMREKDVEQTASWQAFTGGNDGGASDLSVLKTFEDRSRDYTIYANSRYVMQRRYFEDQQKTAGSFKQAYGSLRDEDGVSGLLISDAATHLDGRIQIAHPCYGLETSLFGIGSCNNCSQAAPLAVGGVCIEGVEVPVARPGFCEETGGIRGKRAPANCFRPCPLIDSRGEAMEKPSEGGASGDATPSDDWSRIASYPRDMRRCPGGPSQQPCDMLYRHEELRWMPTVGTCFGVGKMDGSGKSAYDGEQMHDASGNVVSRMQNGVTRDANGRLYIPQSVRMQFQPRTVSGKR